MTTFTEDGFSYNLDENDPVSRMYNETCTLFDTYLVEFPNSMNKWLRPCGDNVVSCFWAQGSYNDECKYIDIRLVMCSSSKFKLLEPN